MPVLNPWLQRLLIGLLGGTSTAGALVVTAKNRYAPKKKKKKKARRPEDRDDDDGTTAARRQRPPPPAIALGTVAKADAAEAFVPSMTWAQWTAGVRQRGRRLVDVLLGRSGKPVVDDDGARLADEVVTADGKRVSPARTATKSGAKKKSTKKGTVQKGTAQKGRRRGRRRQATLFESAKESLRQVVKEEVKKTVDDTVEQTGLKAAVDTIKEASDNVGDVAKDVAQKIKDALPEDAGEKIQSGARSFFAGAKKQAARLRDSIQASLDEAAERRALEEAAEQRRALEEAAPPPDDDVIDMVDGEAALTPTLPETASSTISDDENPAPSTALTRPEPTALQPIEPAPDAEAPREGLSASDVANKVNEGVAKLGSFLVGPGHPDYSANRRRRATSGDVVEAKDPTAKAPDGDDPTGTG